MNKWLLRLNFREMLGTGSCVQKQPEYIQRSCCVISRLRGSPFHGPLPAVSRTIIWFFKAGLRCIDEPPILQCDNERADLDSLSARGL